MLEFCNCLNELCESWLADKSSAMTRREYEKELRYFFETMAGQSINEGLVTDFLKVTQAQANAALSFQSFSRKSLRPFSN